jgi:hypothetical protein
MYYLDAKFHECNPKRTDFGALVSNNACKTLLDNILLQNDKIEIPNAGVYFPRCTLKVNCYLSWNCAKLKPYIILMLVMRKSVTEDRI